MYRDASIALDEHDRAVGALLIGEALVDECDRALARARDEQTATEAQRWRAIAEIHDTFPDIWRHLDRARRVLAARGINTASYDELRPHARRAATNPGLDGSEAFDVAAFDDVRRAIAELKVAVPGADWQAIEQRTQGLVRVPLGRRRRQRLAIASIVGVFLFAAATWFLMIGPVHKPEPRVGMATELRLVTEQRRLKIETLRLDIGEQCLPVIAHELMRQLVLDGRKADAGAFAEAYTERCGDDPVVEHWAAAPRAK